MIIDNQYATFFEWTPYLWPLAHYRIAKLYELAGDPQSAARHYEAYIEVQGNGDADIDRITDARQRIAALRS